MNECVDCGEPIGIRATRCKPCRRTHRTRYERDRVARLDRHSSDSGPASDVIGPVVDYMSGGTRPPSFPGIVHPPGAPTPQQIEVTDGRVPHPRDRAPKRDLTGIPNEVRQDHQKLRKELAKRDEAEMSSWELMQARNSVQADGRMVSFERPALPAFNTRSGRQIDYLGRSIPRARYS
jgi:hypothetical protein